MNLARTSPKEYLSLLEQFKKVLRWKALETPWADTHSDREGTRAVVEASVSCVL